MPGGGARRPARVRAISAPRDCTGLYTRLLSAGMKERRKARFFPSLPHAPSFSLHKLQLQVEGGTVEMEGKGASRQDGCSGQV